MDKVVNKYKPYFTDRAWLLSAGLSILLLIGSFFINQAAGQFATRNVSNSVTDIILDNIPALDVDMIFIYGFIVFWIFVTAWIIYHPTKLPFTLKAIALFVLVRSLFIILTHIAPFPNQAVMAPNRLIHWFTFGGDLFFSGHTGLPFLLAIIFWPERPLRYFFLAASVLFAVVVLLGHYHYSIDVLSAFFITYAIAHLAIWLFPRDHKLFSQT